MNNYSFTSFLDVIACGLGAAILLFLVGTALQEAPKESLANPTLLVRCELVGGSPAFIGIEYQENDGPWTFVNSQTDSKRGYAMGSASRNQDEMVSFLLLFAPKVGILNVRPVLQNFAGTTAEETTKVRLTVSGANLKNLNPPQVSVLTRVGEKGKIQSVEILP